MECMIGNASWNVVVVRIMDFLVYSCHFLPQEGSWMVQGKNIAYISWW